MMDRKGTEYAKFFYKNLRPSGAFAVDLYVWLAECGQF